MNPLTLLFRDRIAADGPISFHDFMAAALYHPEHGHYASGKAEIGRCGDFFTSVSVGPLFGQLLARQFAEMWERLGRPAPFAVVEQGAHGADFAHDCLTFLEQNRADCFAALCYKIVEPSARFRALQQERLAGFGPEKVVWRNSLGDLEPFEGVHFSNELVDAFPVRRVRRVENEWKECAVDWREDRFVLAELPIASDRLHELLSLLPPSLPSGYETEINLAALDWAAEVAAKLQRGWILTIDYGYPRAEYYRPERTSGTLSAYAKHEREDPLDRPGEIDLTSHVEFTSLAARAEAEGLRVCGFTDQHHLMVALGRLAFSDETALTPEKERELRAFKTLMHPNLLGASFKALCLEKDVPQPSPPLAGFFFDRDPRKTLGLSAR